MAVIFNSWNYVSFQISKSSFATNSQGEPLLNPSLKLLASAMCGAGLVRDLPRLILETFSGNLLPSLPPPNTHLKNTVGVCVWGGVCLCRGVCLMQSYLSPEIWLYISNPVYGVSMLFLIHPFPFFYLFTFFFLIYQIFNFIFFLNFIFIFIFILFLFFLGRDKAYHLYSIRHLTMLTSP